MGDTVLVSRAGLVLLACVAAVPLGAQTVHIDSTAAYVRMQPANRAAVETLLGRVGAQFGLERWRLLVVYDTVPRRDSALARPTAGVNAKPQYRMAVLWFDLERLRSADICHVVLHELLHIRLAELTTLALALAEDVPFAQDAVRRASDAAITDLVASATWGCRP